MKLKAIVGAAAIFALAVAGQVSAVGTSVRVNTGGGVYTTGGGATFSADTNFTGGATYSNSVAIAGTTDDLLYQNERWGTWTYSIPVENGSYNVLLHFVELYFVAPCVGKRIFSVDVLDTATVNDVLNLDICAQVGSRTALVRTISNVSVSDGRLDLRGVKGAADNPQIAAIEVLPAGPPPPDTTPPSVSIATPASGATVSSTATVSANASDNVGVAGVQFKLDGANLGAEDTQAPYSFAWDTTTASNGSHMLVAVARDAAGSTTPSAAVPVTVDNAPPTVSITDPVAGAPVAGTINVSADAADNLGVVGVQFTLDGTNLDVEDTSAPYSVPWPTRWAANGPHALAAIARDAAGNRTTAATLTVTVANASDTSNAFVRVVIGPGLVDSSVRQIVRTVDNRVYVFVADDTAQKLGTGPGVIRAYKGNQTGVPTSFAEVGGAGRPTATGTNVLGSPDVRLDANGFAHQLYVNKGNGELVYRTFSTATDSWGAAQVVATGVTVGTHSFRRGETANTLVLDGADVPHVVYTAGSSVLYRNRSGGSWSAAQTIATGTAPIHPQLAVGPDGDLHLAWLEQAATPLVRYARRTGASWGAAEMIASSGVLSNSDLDQGPSIVVTQTGVPYVNYLSALPGSAVRVKYRTGGNWVFDDIPYEAYAHTPQIYSRDDDVYVFSGHDAGINFAYLFHVAGQPWSPYTKLTSQQADGSATVRWDPARETNPGLIDVAFFNENFTGTSNLPQAYYMGVIPELGDTSAPTAPGTVTATGGGGAVALNWGAATDDVGVVHYNVHRSTTAGFTPGAANRIAQPTGTSYGDPGLAPGTYYYRVTAADAAGNVGPPSNEASATATATPPTAPGTLTTTGGDGAVALNWGPASDDVGVDHYNVYRSTTPGFLPSAGNRVAQPTGTSHVDSGLVAGIYFYVVTAEDAAGNIGLPSNEASATATAPDTSPPTTTGTVIAAGGGNAVALSWSVATDDVGVLHYNVHRSITAGFTPSAGNRIAQPTGTSYVDSGLAVGTHYYRVTAEDAAGNIGPPSNEASATVSDTTSPSVSVTVPAGGTAVRATITVTATANDDVGVAGVQFRLDGLALGAEDTLAPYSIAWDTAGATDGLHVLTAAARDAAGNTTSSAQVSVTVDNAAPSVSITVPAGGTTVSATTTVSANASDNAGVAGVQFRLDGATLGAEDTSPPFSIAWNTTGATNGSHPLTAVARDAAGNSTTSAAVTVTVQNGTSGLVAAYGFNEASGTTVTDASGSGNTGTISGATRTSAGRFGSALSFDGVNDWVTVADAQTLDLTRMTLEAWVYPTALSNWRTVLIKEQPGNLVYALYANTGSPGTANRPSGHVFSGADFDTRGTAQLALNTWTHLAATWDGVTLRLYVNGIQVSTRAVGGSMPNSSGPLHFGGNAIWGEWFSGRLDEIRIYSRALSASEIQADMSQAVT